MTLDNPIVIFGSGRNGSSALHARMARHPGVAWISDSLSDKRPDRPGLNRLLMRGIDLPIIGEKLWRRYPPGECYRFWNNYTRCFQSPFRDLLAEDATLLDIKLLPIIFSRLISEKRTRLLLKVTGWPRIGYLHAVFPNAKFIHLVRDGRAVANSLMKVNFWTGWRGPSNWRVGELNSTDEEIWLKHGRSFAALAGLEWKIGCSAAEQAISKLPSGLVCEVRYEDLCTNGLRDLERLLDFVELDLPTSLHDYLQRNPFISQNEKWQADLTPAQQEIITDVSRPYLEKYNYLN